ncbi:MULTISPECIES: hypothetical protein [unclassified Streptomyces]|uniref:hypothetical protein n=1 Tax=unclassified Streptomyces TaxID=2593676 RepID=UPI00382BCAE7
MTTDVRRTNSIQRPETGWARSRRLRGHGIRTCVRATVDGEAVQLRQGADWNIVRGED